MDDEFTTTSYFRGIEAWSRKHSKRYFAGKVFVDWDPEIQTVDEMRDSLVAALRKYGHQRVISRAKPTTEAGREAARRAYHEAGKEYWK